MDFASNDRGAIASRLIGARRRLGWGERGGFWGRKFCYTEHMVPEAKARHESARLAELLSCWQIPPPISLEPEIRADPSLADAAKRILPDQRAIVCHVASSQSKKEWPLAHWAELNRLANEAGFRVVFTTALGQREKALIAELKKLPPIATILPPVPALPLFLAVLARAGVFISGDTGPLHFAAVGADRETTSSFDGQFLLVRRQLGRLPKCQPLPCGNFARTGLWLFAKSPGGTQASLKIRRTPWVAWGSRP